MKPEVINALKVLIEQESIGDFVYDIREREGEGWDGPRVVAFSDAVQVLSEFLKEREQL